MYEISLVSRPKLNLLGLHYGVDMGNGHVIDPQKDGVKVVTRDEFAKGYSVKVESKRRTTPIEWLQIFTILKSSQYDLFENNCEHTSRSIVENKKESRQVQFLIFAAICLAVAYLVSKK